MNLYLVVPCYNEELVLADTTKQLDAYLGGLKEKGIIDNAQILYVDDGSKDTTWVLIEQLHERYDHVSGLKLAHNVGHQHAVWAGMEYCVDKCDAVISIDADLQHDITKIEEMLEKYREGCEVVYGIRNDRATDSAFKKNTALMFYKFMSAMGVDIIPNHADFRLLGSKALKALMAYPERNLFLRGMVRLIGFKTANVYFDVKERMAGNSKYTLSKMLNLALDGITSFSVKPLRVITIIGLISCLLALVEIFYVLYAYTSGATVPGWTSILVSVWLIGSVLILAMGVIGEYIGKIYSEVKRRPRYIIEKQI